MDYVEINVTDLAGYDPEIVIARLGDLGCESFEVTETGVKAYIREDQFHTGQVESHVREMADEIGFRVEVTTIEDRNWNEEWERAYEPVVIDGRCCVRAPFHQPAPGVEYDLVIEPRMSFGTAHHETTSLMIGMLMEEPAEGKRVLDMGCGTGVLAVLAHRMKAASVVAIDNDEWAYANALDNMINNDTTSVRVIRGEADAIPEPGFDLVLANINRNVLLNDIPAYAARMNPGAVLLLSGFYEEDLPL
ncbi:MAG TPA: 50S ribosomal protein L11 methyltransferase, partial [Bacteroidales bacterium]|nr:50S ribosomal protein L11 methyltransferase [Bacteroidales bacterium]